MSKYEKLRAILTSHEAGEWRVSFAELEKLLGVALPVSAYNYPAWWSNNPSNNSMTKVWLNAGWCTEQVDVPGESIVFRRVERVGELAMGQDHDAGAKHQARPPAGMKEKAHMFNNELKPVKKDVFAKLYGCMKGTIKIMPGIDVTAPVYSDDEWAEIEAESDRKWDEQLKPVPNKPGAT